MNGKHTLISTVHCPLRNKIDDFLENEVEIETTNSGDENEINAIPDNFNLRDELAHLKVMANYAADKGFANLYKTVSASICECEKVLMSVKLTQKPITDYFTI